MRVLTQYLRVIKTKKSNIVRRLCVNQYRIECDRYRQQCVPIGRRDYIERCADRRLAA